MNAKKIMGAVLVALLAAALFVGAGAAADEGVDVIYVYEKTDYAGTWTNEDGDKSVTFVNGYLSGDDITEGIYYGKEVNGTKPAINVKYPDAKIEAVVNDQISIVGGTIPDDAEITFSLNGYTDAYGTPVSGSFGNVSDDVNLTIIFTNPDGVQTFALNGKDALVWDNGTATYDVTGADAGEWKMQAFFNVPTTDETGLLVKTTPDKYKYGQTVYTFTIVDNDYDIAISADTVVKSNTFVVTLSGYPGYWAKIYCNDEDAELITPVAGQTNVYGENLSSTHITGNDGGVWAKISDSGKKQVAFTANGDDGKYTIRVQFFKNEQCTDHADDDEHTAKINVIDGDVTAAAEKDFYYLGNDITLTGTNTESKYVYLYIKGSNVDFQSLNGKGVSAENQYKVSVESDDTWEEEIDGSKFKNFDAGTYTIYAVSTNLKQVQTEDSIQEDLDDYLSDYAYASVSVVLKQPFLSADLSSSVVAQDSDLIITGTAEAADAKGLIFYVFGNNKFATGTITVEDDGTFEEEIDIDEDDYATGQYFVVIQHPMYDGEFNIGPVWVDADGNKVSADPEATVGNKLNANIVLNTDGAYSNDTSKTVEILFNTGKRQSANAAEALCQALDTQNIDDIYVKASFVVATPTASMNPVSDVAKGSKLVVSGTSNMAPGEAVTVEMLSTAFAAIPKESVNSASFMSLVTKVQDDGTWEVTFDTAGLNVDEYTLSATIGDIKTSAVIVKVTEGTPATPDTPANPDTPDTPVTPDTPDTPDTPTEPSTPGFGALAALAGLGAVAVLLLRRE